MHYVRLHETGSNRKLFRFDSIGFDLKRAYTKCILDHLNAHNSLILIVLHLLFVSLRFVIVIFCLLFLLFIRLIHMVYYRARYSLDIFINHDFPHIHIASRLFVEMFFFQITHTHNTHIFTDTFIESHPIHLLHMNRSWTKFPLIGFKFIFHDRSPKSRTCTFARLKSWWMNLGCFFGQLYSELWRVDSHLQLLWTINRGDIE